MAERIPEINGQNTGELVQLAAGTDADVFVHEVRDGRTDAVSSSSLSDDVAEQVLRRLRIDDPTVETLCRTVARAAVARLAASDGFTAYFGEMSNPREILRVSLRPLGTVPIEAEVTRTTGDQ